MCNLYYPNENTSFSIYFFPNIQFRSNREEKNKKYRIVTAGDCSKLANFRSIHSRKRLSAGTRRRVSGIGVKWGVGPQKRLSRINAIPIQK